MKYKAKSMMSLNEMVGLAIDYEGDGYVTGYPIVSDNDAYILNGVIEANEEYIVINQWVPVFPESLKPVSPSLTDDQQVVLEYLQKRIPDYEGIGGILLDGLFLPTDKIEEIIDNMEDEKLFQVLAAFAEWGLSNL